MLKHPRHRAGPATPDRAHSRKIEANVTETERADSDFVQWRFHLRRLSCRCWARIKRTTGAFGTPRPPAMRQAISQLQRRWYEQCPEHANCRASTRLTERVTYDNGVIAITKAILRSGVPAQEYACVTAVNICEMHARCAGSRGNVGGWML
jgi:hypothetical protein